MHPEGSEDKENVPTHAECLCSLPSLIPLTPKRPRESSMGLSPRKEFERIRLPGDQTLAQQVGGLLNDTRVRMSSTLF